jgi:hypothetical protein
MRHTAATAAMLAAILCVCCSTKNAPANQRAESPEAPQQTPVPAMATPIPPPVITPPPSIAGPISNFLGEVNRGQPYEKTFAPGMVFRLEPFAGNDSGWDIRIAPDTEPSPASIDCIGAIAVPRHGSDDLSIELPQERTAQGVALAKSHEFEFVPNPSDCKRAWDLNNSLAYNNNLTDKESNDLDRMLSQIPNAHGDMKILDSRLTSPSGSDKSGAIEWIKFEVHLQISQPDNPALAKARASAAPAGEATSPADPGISYSPPSAFAQLPSKIQSELQSFGCRIPQPFGGSAYPNVIEGQFARPGQTDWAVLCSKDNRSAILIFWNGSERAPTALESAPDSNYLTPLENGKIGFSRAISPVGNKFIIAQYRANGGPKPPPIDHDGINDEFLEKGSTVHYFFQGQWLELTGSD